MTGSLSLRVTDPVLDEDVAEGLDLDSSERCFRCIMGVHRLSTPIPHSLVLGCCGDHKSNNGPWPRV